MTLTNITPKKKSLPSGLLLCVIQFLLIVNSGIAQSGKLPDFFGNKQTELDPCPPTLGFGPDYEVDSMVTMILKRIGVTTNRYIVKSCTTIGNCQADFMNEKPYILYNPTFLSKIKGLNFSLATLNAQNINDWKVLTILAHELGHHQNNHLTNPGQQTTTKQMEIEADETAGFIIYLLGGKLEEAQAVYHTSFVSTQETYDYPSREGRLQAIARGWENAHTLYPSQRQNIGATTDPVKVREELYYYHFRRGARYVEIEEYQKAIEELKEAIKVDGLNADAYSERGWVNIKLKDYQKALEDYNKAIKLNPRFVTVYNKRGNLKINYLEDVQGALADYDKAIEIDPEYFISYYNRAFIREGLEDYKGALADYNKTIQLNSSYARAYYKRADLKANELEDAKGALADYNKVIELEPKNIEAYFDRALHKNMEFEDYQGALADYNKVLEFSPANTTAYHRRGLLKHFQLKNYQEALADYTRAIELDPKFELAYYDRGRLKKDNLNDKQGACADFRKGADLGDTNAIRMISEVCN